MEEGYNLKKGMVSMELVCGVWDVERDRSEKGGSD